MVARQDLDEIVEALQHATFVRSQRPRDENLLLVRLLRKADKEEERHDRRLERQEAQRSRVAPQELRVARGEHAELTPRRAWTRQRIEERLREPRHGRSRWRRSSYRLGDHGPIAVRTRSDEPPVGNLEIGLRQTFGQQQAARCRLEPLLDILAVERRCLEGDFPLLGRSVSETVVENLRVLAIDAPDTKPVQAAANPATGNFGRIVTLEVTPEQAEQINVATELGKLSLTLRSATDYASASPASPTFLKAVARPVDGHVRPTWAGDVSPALTGAVEKPVVTEPQTVTILRGFKPQGGKERAEPEIVKLN